MNTNVNTGKIVGILLLTFVILGGIGGRIRGLTKSLIESLSFLMDVFSNSIQMKTAVLLELVATIMIVAIAVLLFPFLKKQSKNMALWLIALSIMLFAIIVMGDISHLSLISLSKEFVNAGISENTDYNLLGIMRVREYYLAHFLGLSVFSLWLSVFCYFLYITKLIPRFLSIWGLVTAALVLIGAWLSIFDFEVNQMLFRNNGVYIIVLSLWLIFKGFDPTRNLTRFD